MRTRIGVSDLKLPGDTTADTDVEKAEVLNSFFASVFTEEDLENQPTFAERACGVQLTTVNITSERVKNIIKNLNTAKSPGPDGMHPCVLVALKKELTKPIKMIFEISLYQGCLPQCWREGHVTPVFKKGKRDTPENSRPVSLMSVTCKVMETMIRDNVKGHMTLVSSLQHGFIHGR